MEVADQNSPRQRTIVQEVGLRAEKGQRNSTAPAQYDPDRLHQQRARTCPCEVPIPPQRIVQDGGPLQNVPHLLRHNRHIQNPLQAA
eukprot:693571-Prymnesium_polylepis.1